MIQSSETMKRENNKNRPTMKMGCQSRAQRTRKGEKNEGRLLFKRLKHRSVQAGTGEFNQMSIKRYPCALLGPLDATRGEEGNLAV